MLFTRYEIRWYTHRCIYEGGNAMEYIYFDTLKQAEDYIKANPETCTSDEETQCGLYRVRLYSSYDVPELIREL